MPHIVLHWPAILVSALAAFIFGGLWYGPIFGRTWLRLMGWENAARPHKSVMQRAMILQAVGLFLTSFVLAHLVQVWRPSAWGVGTDASDAMYGFQTGFFTWLGFYLPLQMGKIGWENRPWKLLFLNAGHDFVNLQIIAQILAHWH